MSEQHNDLSFNENSNENMTLKAIGKFIFLARKERGWTQEELADAAGLSHDIVNAMENGRRKAGLPAYSKVAETLGISFAIGVPIRESDSRDE